MTRRNNPGVRCDRCRVHRSVCFCAQLPVIATRTRLALVVHRDEERKSTNTGCLAARCLVNSEVWIRGRRDEPDPPITFAAASARLLFPHDDASPLPESVTPGEPITLVVPDGTWRQASKMRQRVPGLRDVPCVSLPPGLPSAYRLRRNPHEAGVSTIEAIARALGVLEGPEVELALGRVLRLLVERTLWSRGRLDESQLTEALPEGALQHDPSSGLALGRPPLHELERS